MRAWRSVSICLAGGVAAIAMLLSIAPAAADPAGSASGTLRLDDQPTALTHAYVIEVNELPEMRFGDGPARYLTVLLTDRELPAERKPSELWAIQLSFEGGLRGVGVKIDPQTGAVMSGRTLLPQDELPQYFTVITMGPAPMVVLEGWAAAEGSVRGHLRTPEPMEVVNFEDRPGPAAFTFESDFEAEIIPAPKLVEELSGDAARQSPPAAALHRFAAAIATRDLAAVKETMAEGDAMRERVTAEDIEGMNAMLFQTASDPDGVLAEVSKIYLFDNDTAVAVISRGEDGATTFPLAAVDGDWKLGQP